MPVVLPAPDTGLRQPAEQTAWTAPSPSCRIVVEWVTTVGVLPVNDRTAHHACHPPGTRAREVTSLASSPVSCLRPREDLAGPGHARRLRGTRHLPEPGRPGGRHAGSGEDQNVR